VDMDISMDIHAKICGYGINMDGKFHIHGKPANMAQMRKSVGRRSVGRSSIYTSSYTVLIYSSSLR